MKRKFKHDRAWLLATARGVAIGLKHCRAGTRLRIRIPRATIPTNTNGWSAVIGDLGKGQPKLEIWLDRFSGYRARKLFACIRSETRQPLVNITKRVRQRLWPSRIITLGEIDQETYVVLKKRVGRYEFNRPFLEKYENGATFYGIYDQTRQSIEKVNSHFCTRAEAFFEDVARSLPRATGEDEQGEIFPQCENRKKVASHLHRERSKLLATECKNRDNYQCQICGLRFEDAYGKIGQEFAKAHHLVPLNRLREKVKTRLADLSTVCSNCHRMLHKMAGQRGDMRKLRVIWRNQYPRRKKA